MKINDIKSLTIRRKYFELASDFETLKIILGKNDCVFILINSLIMSNQIKIKDFNFATE